MSRADASDASDGQKTPESSISAAPPNTSSLAFRASSADVSSDDGSDSTLVSSSIFTIPLSVPSVVLILLSVTPNPG